MTRQDAKRWVCDRAQKALTAGLVEDEANESLSPADRARVQEATESLIRELKRRAGYTSPAGSN